MEKNSKIIAGLVVFILVMFVVVTGVLLDKKESVEVTPIKEEVAEKDNALKDEYIDGCYDGSNAVYCECTYNYMIENVGEKGFLEAAFEFDETGEIPELLLDAIIECL